MGSLTPQEITALAQVIVLLEPEAQRGIEALVHLIHKKKPQMSAEDYVKMAEQYIRDQDQGSG